MVTQELRATSRRLPRNNDMDINDLIQYNGAYQIYMQAIQQETWRCCRLKGTGLLRYPSIAYVPPVNAMCLIKYLANELDDIDWTVINEKGKANIITRLPIKEWKHMSAMCAFQDIDRRFGFGQCRLLRKHGSLAFVTGLSIEHYEGRGNRMPLSRLEFVHVVWKLTPHGDLRPGPIPYHTIPYHTMPCHAIPCHTIPYHTIPYHTIPYHTIPYHTIPYHTIPYHTMPCHTIPYQVRM